MQQELFIEYQDYSQKKVLVGLSGGINSMAVLMWLATYPEEFKPKELHLYYADFKEHSPDTLPFVLAGVEYAKKKFEKVIYVQTENSVMDYFRKQNMIPHPKFSPCSIDLKIIPMANYAKENGIDIDLIGYVKEEGRRIKRMHNRNEETKKTKGFPIGHQTNEWCFQITKRDLGWYPKIYDIRNSKGERIFTHNNCLPCKNMQMDYFEQVKEYYPEYWQKAIDLSEELKAHWGRDKEEYLRIYVTFGRDDWETDYQKQSCPNCDFD